MNLGNKTINFRAYDRSKGKPEEISDLVSYKRPNLELLSDTMKGAGINGEINMPTLAQVGSLGVELSFKKTNKKSAELFAQKQQDIEVRWAVDVVDSTSGAVKIESNKDIIKGYPKGIDLGKVENGTTGDAVCNLEVVYINHIVDGVSMLEIDKLNNVFKIAGVDYAAKIREAL